MTSRRTSRRREAPARKKLGEIARKALTALKACCDAVGHPRPKRQNELNKKRKKGHPTPPDGIKLNEASQRALTRAVNEDFNPLPRTALKLADDFLRQIRSKWNAQNETEQRRIRSAWMQFLEDIRSLKKVLPASPLDSEADSLPAFFAKLVSNQDTAEIVRRHGSGSVVEPNAPVLEAQIDALCQEQAKGICDWIMTPRLRACARRIIAANARSLNAAKVLYHAADACCHEAKYADAQHLYGEAISRFEAFGHDASVERSKCYLGKGLCAWFLHDYDTAGELYDCAFTEAAGSDPLQHAACLVHAAGLDLIRQCFPEAKSNLKRAETLLKGRETTDEFAWMLHNRGRILLAEHFLPEGRECFERSLRILEDNHKDDKRDLIHGLCNLIRISALEGDFEAGHRCKASAEQCLDQYAGHNHLFAGLFHAHCGVLYREEEKYEHAEESFGESFDHFKRRKREDPSKAYAHFEFASLQFARRANGTASQHVDNARKIYAKFLGKESLSVARCDVMIGKIALHRSQPDEAYGRFNRAWENLRHLVSEKHPDFRFLQENLDLEQA